MQKVIKAIIFDLDGVIIDSNPEIEKFWHRWAKKTKRQLTRQNITEHIHGRKGVETLAALFNDIDDKTKEAIIKDAVEFDSQMNPEPIKGIYHFIQTLLQLKIPVGLVTSSHEKRALLMLQKQNLHNSFEAHVTAEEVTNGKPHPEPYLTIAKKLNQHPAYCLVFEDAISGVLSAKAAGMEVIGVNTEEAAQSLLNYGAACIISSFEELRVEQNILLGKNGISYTLQAP
ncbi:HAD family hydrolase [Ilyomonas limi]|uniref:HAD family hydrolase n=1 Tax=Ilyomonas limi TaxID=2575867 RepID=A0A4U3L299_9BACT|nr:HAD-IA family hydrolase [Ilyomonas limi]TKK67656.1 HAD family hydrolase [Ilyomonas limi]